MLRSTLLTLTLALALGIAAGAQVVVNGGYATTYPVAVSPQMTNTVTTNDIPSVPAINPPVAHVGPDAEVQGQTAAAQQAPVGTQPAVVQIQNPQPVMVEVAPSTTAAGQPVIGLGAAAIDVNPFLAGGQETSDQSLGEIAREWKQKDQAINAKTYTNADVEKLNQTASGNGTTTNAQNDNWPTNNGVITPQPNNGQGAIAAPAQNQSTTGNNPFAPRTQNNAPAAGTDNNGNQPENPPQANAKPTAERPYEMAQNNPGNAGIPQQAEESNSSTENTSSQNGTLPKTATRLPLLGVLGFFSISMGLFVRYQRAKDAK